MQSQAQVTVNILNDNDHLPSFASSSYTFEIAENSPPQTLTSTNPAGLTMIQVGQISESDKYLAASLELVTRPFLLPFPIWLNLSCNNYNNYVHVPVGNRQ